MPDAVHKCNTELSHEYESKYIIMCKVCKFYCALCVWLEDVACCDTILIILGETFKDII